MLLSVSSKPLIKRAGSDAKPAAQPKQATPTSTTSNQKKAAALRVPVAAPKKKASSPSPSASPPPKKKETVRQYALRCLDAQRDESKSGTCCVRWNHYKKLFPVHNGVVAFAHIDEEYSFSFVYRGSFERYLTRPRDKDDNSGGGGAKAKFTEEKEDDEEEEERRRRVRCDIEMDYFVDVRPEEVLYISIIEDPVAGVGAEGLTLREGPVQRMASFTSSPSAVAAAGSKCGNKAVADITSDLLKMRVDELHSAEAKTLREARDLEDILFSSSNNDND